VTGHCHERQLPESIRWDVWPGHALEPIGQECRVETVGEDVEDNQNSIN
jgi:hypothetical protein